jgi:hypothetical protein
VVKDATASYLDQAMQAALDVNLPNYANAILTTDEVVESIAKPHELSNDTAKRRRRSELQAPDPASPSQPYKFCPYSRRPCKSFVKGNRILLSARLGSAQDADARTGSSHVCLSAGGSCSSQNRTSICCLGPEGRHRRLSLCSLPVPKQFEGASGV